MHTLTQSRHRYLGHPSFSVHGDKRVYSAPLIHLGKYPFIGLPFKLSPIHRDTATSMTQRPSAKPPHPSLPRHRVSIEGLRQGSSPRGGYIMVLIWYLGKSQLSYQASIASFIVKQHPLVSLLSSKLCKSKWENGVAITHEVVLCMWHSCSRQVAT